MQMQWSCDVTFYNQHYLEELEKYLQSIVSERDIIYLRHDMIYCKSKPAILRLWWGLNLCTPTFLCSSRYRFLRCVYDLRVLLWNGAEMESLQRERRDEENVKTFFPSKKYNTMHKHDGQQNNCMKYGTWPFIQRQLASGFVTGSSYWRAPPKLGFVAETKQYV